MKCYVCGKSISGWITRTCKICGHMICEGCIKDGVCKACKVKHNM